jgi:hypothetical protein
MTRRFFSFRPAAAASLFALSALAASAEESPMRKAGLWEIKIQNSDSGPEILTTQNCTDEATDRETEAIFAWRPNETCPKIDFRKTATPTGYVTNSVCSGAGTTTTWRTEFTGDYDSAYTKKTTAHREGGPANVPRDVTITFEAKRLGPCKADQQPGDFESPGGYKFSIKSLKNMGLLPK